MSSFQITPNTRMAELEAGVPGARRALFARYHIGGCSSCGFSPDETLASVCERNENLPVQEVIDHLQESAQRDRDLQISVQEVNASLKAGEKLRLIDVRSREEHEAVALPDSELLSQDLISTLFAGPKGRTNRRVLPPWRAQPGRRGISHGPRAQQCEEHGRGNRCMELRGG